MALQSQGLALAVAVSPELAAEVGPELAAEVDLELLLKSARSLLP